MTSIDQGSTVVVENGHNDARGIVVKQ
jgi:hypothetical protein